MWTGSSRAARSEPSFGGRCRQGGIVLILYVLSALVIVGMAGMALDLGMVYVTKTRLQNAVDAAALDGAKTLVNDPLGVVAAKGNATSTLDLNFPGASAHLQPIETSATFPFPGVATPAKFVKVTVTDVPVTTYLINVFRSGNTMPVGATAIAGPQQLSNSCGLPIGICAATPNAPGGGVGGTVCDGTDGCYGLLPVETTLKSDVYGPGNFGLLDNGSGASDINDGFAGAKDKCYSPGPKKVDSQTGMQDSNVSALNSRFGTANGQYGDQSVYPPDTKTLPASWFSNLAYSGAGIDTPGGQAGRRKILVSVIDCTCPSGTCNGSKKVTVLATACMLMTRPVSKGGVDDGTVYVQMVDECLASGGTPGGSGGGGAVRVVLYQAGAQS